MAFGPEVAAFRASLPVHVGLRRAPYTARRQHAPESEKNEVRATIAGASDGAPDAAVYFDRDTAARGEIERFIHSRFARAYGADLRTFLPGLLSLRDADGALRAALGFAPAAGRRLYLERYLDTPIEAALGYAAHQSIAREEVMEVGNLAVTCAGGARLLLTALTAYLHSGDYRLAIFTAVPLLRNSFARLGIDLIEVAAADPARLDRSERNAWGRYYERGATVMAASVAQSRAALMRALLAEAAVGPLHALWRRAAELGGR